MSSRADKASGFTLSKPIKSTYYYIIYYYYIIILFFFSTWSRDQLHGITMEIRWSSIKNGVHNFLLLLLFIFLIIIISIIYIVLK